MLKKIASSIAVGLVLCLMGGEAIAASPPPCDYSFIVRQPIFRLVAPQESSTDVSLGTALGVATDDGDFSVIKQVQLEDDAGHSLILAPNFKVVSKATYARPEHAGNSPPLIATMAVPVLKPSTTYDVVLAVRAVSVPPHCPKVLTEHIARFTTESATSLDAIALAHAAAAPPSGGKLSGPEIFEKTLQELRSLEYPPVVSFLVTMHATIKGKSFVESFRSAVRTSDDVVTTHSVPVATTNQPESPWGWRIQIPLLSSLFPQHRKDNHEEPFGVPEVSPIYAFGLLPPKPAQFPGERSFGNDPDVKSLGRVLTVARYYDATLLGLEQYRSRWVYHLKLAPIGDPKVYRLREAWVDTQAFVIWKLRSAGIFDRGPATTVPWDVNYTAVDGHWFMAEESTTSSVRTGGFLANTPEVRYDGISYTFSDFTYPADSFDFDFFSELKTDAVQY